MYCLGVLNRSMGGGVKATAWNETNLSFEQGKKKIKKKNLKNCKKQLLFLKFFSFLVFIIFLAFFFTSKPNLKCYHAYEFLSE